jgi:hypothetical protein
MPINSLFDSHFSSFFYVENYILRILFSFKPSII